MIATSKSGKEGGGPPTQSPFLEEPPLPVPPNEVSRSNKSRAGANPAPGPREDSLLKKAIKENENSIIQSILSPITSSPNNNSNSEGMSPLLDYLFEDGQLTRIEYDLVDQAIGIETPTEQAQALLRILVESKDDEALAILLEYLRNNRQDPSTSDTIAKLSSSFQPTRKSFYNKYYYLEGGLPSTASSAPSPSVSKSGIGIREILEVTRRHSLNSRLNIKEGDSSSDDRITRVPFRVNLSCVGNAGSRQNRHDFYYGRNRTLPLEKKVIPVETDEDKIDEEDDDDDEPGEDEWEWFGYMNSARAENQEGLQQTMRKEAIPDFRDFYLTNACLETVRHLIIADCPESLAASAWQRVLKNMNGLLNTDMQSIKDLLLNSNSKSEYQSEIHGKVGNNPFISNYTRAFQVNWDQIIYHSFQVWKRRNGLNSTFYSLIGLFQHSHLYQTADFLLSHKMSIQVRENEKDPPEEDVIVDGNGNTVTSKRLSTTSSSSSVIMLEKSDFLRKFYSPSNKRGNGPLSTGKERVSVSPVLSLDLS